MPERLDSVSSPTFTHSSMRYIKHKADGTRDGGYGMGILEKMRLDGKISLVTRGGKGHLQGDCVGLAEAGSSVAIIDMDLKEARHTAKAITAATGWNIKAYQADVTDEAQDDGVVDAIVRDFGRLDMAFCNAGICMNIPTSEMTLAQL